jgi:hypothetical protein
MTENEFIKFWNKAKSVAEVAKKLGIQAISASVRASLYRARGRQLKSFAPGQ